ncbi:tripartite tricarboxylate transporter substrate binding protein [Variovorax sp. UMC13]|jgi:tripartite-type tricarboxylate transporter receptor subunit TctC|uniref:tripartite tricarboxylate transporter substrate binding protein n=1 Tax=Variovorax sp. UMC13 TaxID=1862326 RepID=UPI00160485AC|nr:tripartite tricarboxylate transporter substrate binding protein [Variovorax sp. UMC13]MBB1602892.1 hypothetical protein [Variovorax sp. UMC13]
MTKTLHRRALCAALLASAIAVPAFAAEPNDWPNRPLRVIIPFAPGGATDVAARIVGQELAKELGQPVVIENRPGGNNLIAARALLSSKPDGYTIMAAGADALSIVPLLYDAPYKVEQDFTFIASMMTAPYVLVARGDFPANNLKEFTERLRADGTKLNYGSFGVGSVTHLGTQMMLNQMGVSATMIPYPGGTAPAVQALVAKQIDFILTDVPGSLQFVKSGQLRAYAWTGHGLKGVLPELPTMAKAGLPNYFFDPYVGIIAPAGVPAPIAEKLSAAFKKVLTLESVRKDFESRGVVATYLPGSGLREQALTMAQQMQKVINENKISVK